MNKTDEEKELEKLFRKGMSLSPVIFQLQKSTVSFISRGKEKEYWSTKKKSFHFEIKFKCIIPNTYHLTLFAMGYC